LGPPTKPGLASQAGFGFSPHIFMTSLRHNARASIIAAMMIIRRQPGHGDVA
jgi:hypothetical protein